MTTRRNFLKGIVAGFISTYATGTRLNIPETDQELQILSEVHTVKLSPVASAAGRQSDMVDFGDARLHQIRMIADYGTAPSPGELTEIYLVPEGAVDERDCLFVGGLFSDGEETRQVGKWLVHVPDKSFRVVAVGESLKETNISLTPLEIEVT